MEGHQMSEQQQREEGRPDIPIENGFPIERVNEIAEKESRAKRYYRPLYTMHKWWARRPGCLFRAITLYSMLDGDTSADEIEVYEPGGNHQLGNNDLYEDLINAIEDVDMGNPEPLWEFYPKDVRIKNKKILDPFMGGGTSLVESSRFGIESRGVDLNPVAWFVTKKQIEAGKTSAEEVRKSFDRLKEDVADDIRQYYQTPCPNGDHYADVMYNFWVKEIECVSCSSTIPLFKDYRVADGRYESDDLHHIYCPSCGNVSLTDDWKDTCECPECSHEWNPKNGNTARGGYYVCHDCGQKERISETTADQGLPNQRLYATEYYCSTCDENGLEKSAHKGYKGACQFDKSLLQEVQEEWKNSDELHDYVPSQKIPEGLKTADMPDLSDHGYEYWTDTFLTRQLLSLSKILQRIDQIEDQNVKEYLLLAFSDSLMFQNTYSIYNVQANKIEGLFRLNSFVPQSEFMENNVWGAKFGRGNFSNTIDKLIKGVEYAQNPTDRYVEDGTTEETEEFSQHIGNDVEVYQGDMRKIDAQDEYDAVITDPPYYDNIIYSELSDYFYVWQKILLDEEYNCFQPHKTPRKDSIVTNKFHGKTKEDFESELHQAFSIIRKALKENGVLSFTYHHSDSESWGELLTALCDVGFEVTATYPINSDLNKFIDGEAVSFDIVIVARPTESRRPISWDSLRRHIVRTARETRETLERNRELSTGDIGVIEMGKCFQEYSKHHGEVHRAGEVMSAKEVVEEIYGIIQDNDRGEEDVYRDLLEEDNPTYNDLNKHLKRSDASEAQMREMNLFRTDGSKFVLCGWDDEKRQAYVQRKVEEDNGDLTTLDKAHFLRYRFEQGKSTSNYLEHWNKDELRELCEGLAELTRDETYLKMVGVDTSLTEFGKE
jgi:adenine-specific DNA methylase